MVDLQDDKVRENRLRRMAERRGYELNKSRRRDPLAVDYGEWWITRGRVSGMALQRQGPFKTLDEVEDFLNAKWRPAIPNEGDA
jgi:hypothetical protein